MEHDSSLTLLRWMLVPIESQLCFHLNRHCFSGKSFHECTKQKRKILKSELKNDLDWIFKILLHTTMKLHKHASAQRVARKKYLEIFLIFQHMEFILSNIVVHSFFSFVFWSLHHLLLSFCCSVHCLRIVARLRISNMFVTVAFTWLFLYKQKRQVSSMASTDVRHSNAYSYEPHNQIPQEENITTLHR